MSRRRSFDGSVLKTAVVVGSLVATLVGGELLAAQPSEMTDSVDTNVQELVVPQEDGAFVFELEPIPELVIPEPIARSQSSR